MTSYCSFPQGMLHLGNSDPIEASVETTQQCSKLWSVPKEHNWIPSQIKLNRLQQTVEKNYLGVKHMPSIMCLIYVISTKTKHHIYQPKTEVLI